MIGNWIYFCMFFLSTCLSLKGESWIYQWKRGTFLPKTILAKTVSYGIPYNIPDDSVQGLVFDYPINDLEFLEKFQNLRFIKIEINLFNSTCSEILEKLPSEGIEYLIISSKDEPHPIIRKDLGSLLLNRHKTLSDKVYKFTSLKKLVLEGSFHLLGNGIQHLNQLEHLEILSSNLQEFPKEVDQLEKLETLIISGHRMASERFQIHENTISEFTHINKINTDMSRIRGLKHIEIWSDELREWPESFQTFNHIKNINVISPILRTIKIKQIPDFTNIGLYHMHGLEKIEIGKLNQNTVFDIIDTSGLQKYLAGAITKLTKQGILTKIVINSTALVKNSRLIRNLNSLDSIIIRPDDSKVLSSIDDANFISKGGPRVRIIDNSVWRKAQQKISITQCEVPSKDYLFCTHASLRCQNSIPTSDLLNFKYLHSLKLESDSVILINSGEGHWEFLEFLSIKTKKEFLNIDNLLMNSPNLDRLELRGGSFIFSKKVRCKDVSSIPERIILNDVSIDKNFVRWLNCSQKTLDLVVFDCNDETFSKLLLLKDNCNVHINYSDIPMGLEGVALIKSSNWTIGLPNYDKSKTKHIKDAIEKIGLKTE